MEMTKFRNEKFGEIRTAEINGEIWLVGKDIAVALGYEKPSNAIMAHVDAEDKLNSKTLLSLSETQPRFRAEFDFKELGQRGGWLINESGLYSLILSSKLETAKEFKHWVTSEVLPSIRKTGSYNAPRISKEELEARKKEAEAKSKEYNLGVYDRLHSLANEYAEKSEAYRQVLDAHATKALAGEFLLPLPETEKTYSATEIGDMLGVSANRVGKIANANGMKTAEFGKYFIDKSKFSAREVQTFRYNRKAIDRIRQLLREAE